jgi:uncharacterized protein YutE (UPF0331/DUF86 family)
MYFVDRTKIEESLTYIESNLHILEEHSSWTTSIERLALERIVHMVIEAMIDVGNAMIDGFIMRDPGSYEDIIDILNDEKVIADGESSDLKELFSLRKRLIYAYQGIEHDELLKTVEKVNLSAKQFVPSVQRYLDEELGPVSAFKPTK